MMGVNSTFVILEDDEYLVKYKKLVTTKPNYFMIGNGTINKHRVLGIDLLQQLADATKAGQWLMLYIKNGITKENNYNPVVRINKKELTSTEKQYLIKGYAELNTKNIVRRIKQSHYMINPNALIPPYYDNAIKIWNSKVLITKKDKDSST